SPHGLPRDGGTSVGLRCRFRLRHAGALGSGRNRQALSRSPSRRVARARVGPVVAAEAGFARLRQRRLSVSAICVKSSWPAKRAGLHAALISRILNFIEPRGASTSTVSPFFLPMIALPTGDSFESLFSAGFASAEPTIRYSTVCFAPMSRRRTFEPTETTSLATSFLLST